MNEFFPRPANANDVRNELIATADQSVQAYFRQHSEQMKQEALRLGLTEQEALQVLERTFQRGLREIEEYAKKEADNIIQAQQKSTQTLRNVGKA